ncbi:MAG TPA: dihydrofolate reductase family protein [Candidatus Peribacteraceae bacterium]|nr:dihydrofolate reductase family protein [Candidatus Peribacteraceae bacterium]
MRKLIMWNVVTLDGCFEGEKSWDLSFHQIVWGEELERFVIEQLQTVGTIVFGKTTYEGMAAYWQNEKDETAEYMNSLPKVVCSSTIEKADWNNSTIVRDAATEIPKLKKQEGKDVFVFGSGNLSETLMKERLFDEYRLLIAPVFLGKGKKLFADGLPYQKLTLLESRPLATGGIILRYAHVTDEIRH